MGLWKKVGKVIELGNQDIVFRDTNDYGQPEIKVSERWYVWQMNQPFERVGKLPEKYRKSEIGVIVPPDSILERLKTGKYHFVYPGYE